jgi:hypothetical protein
MADETRWAVERRRYFFGQWVEGVAELVRAERHDGVAWVRVLEAVYWWPEQEGKDWPCCVIAPPDCDGRGESNAWAYFEQVRQHDARYRWEPLPTADPPA